MIVSKEDALAIALLRNTQRGVTGVGLTVLEDAELHLLNRMLGLLDLPYNAVPE